MRLIMAISADGFVARNASDPMDWTGLQDKWAFRLLTSVGGRCIAGRVTAELLPKLPGRIVQPISSKGMSLDEAYFDCDFDSAWILGGQTLAISAFEKGYIEEVHICYSNARLEEGVVQQIEPWLQSMPHVMTNKIPGVRIEVFIRKPYAWRN